MGRRAVAALALVLTAAAATAAVRPAVDSVLPSVAHAPGKLAGSEFHTDLWIFNPGTVTATVTVYFYPRDNAYQPPPAATLEDVAPGEVREVDDAVLSLFALTDAVGGLRFVSTQPVVVTARVYDTSVQGSNGTGTAGQFDAATPVAEGVRSGQKTSIVGTRGVTQNSFPLWRTNVAFMNASAGATRVALTLLNPDGSEVPPVGSPTYFDLGAWEPKQLNDVFAKLGRPEGTNLRVELRVLSGGPVVVLGSMLDGRTNDPSTIEMTATPAGDGEYLCKVDKTTYDTPVTLTLADGAITALDATIVFTEEDVPSCEGELLRLAGTLPVPVQPDDLGQFSLSLSGNPEGDPSVSVTLQLTGTLAPTGTITGSATTTLAGAGSCDGSKTWPLVGAHLP
jgi:hypothetical protein